MFKLKNGRLQLDRLLDRVGLLYEHFQLLVSRVQIIVYDLVVPGALAVADVQLFDGSVQALLDRLLGLGAPASQSLLEHLQVRRTNEDAFRIQICLLQTSNTLDIHVQYADLALALDVFHGSFAASEEEAREAVRQSGVRTIQQVPTSSVVTIEQARRSNKLVDQISSSNRPVRMRQLPGSVQIATEFGRLNEFAVRHEQLHLLTLHEVVVFAIDLAVSRLASGVRGAEPEAVLEIAHQSLEQGGLSGAYSVRRIERWERGEIRMR